MPPSPHLTTSDPGLPSRSWVMRQDWHDLLFAHYPFPPAALEPFIPPGLVLDTHDRTAWLAIVPFRMSRVRLRGTPALPWLSAFPELNVRTYARTPCGSRRGVVFLSLDAGNRIAVHVARRWYHLPYFRARMRCETDGEGIRYESRRTHLRAPPADLVARYRPTGPPARSEAGSLEHFLTERYWLFVADARRRTRAARVDHPPWPLQPAEAELEHNSMAAAHGLELPDVPPLLHFARVLDVRAWAPEPLEA